MKKRFVFLSCFIILFVGWLLFADDFVNYRWEKGKEICRDYCNVSKDVIMSVDNYFEKDFFYFNDGYCGCSNYRTRTSSIVITPITNQIREPVILE